MLHAFNQKQVRRVLARDGHEHQNEKTEDAITSMVFSPLTFMQAIDAFDCLGAVLGRRLRDAAMGRLPVHHTVELWPRGLLADAWDGEGETSCEPDLIVTFLFDRGDPVIVIGEMKWDWRMKPDGLKRELERERAAVHAARAGVIVMFVVSKYPYAPLRDDAELLTWTTFWERLAHLLALGELRSAARWADLVRTFLKKADVNGFAGFAASQAPPALSDLIYAFWTASL